jgi:Tfp pilus assembly protein PilN
MSKPLTAALPAVEWSPAGIRAYVPGEGVVSRIPSGWAAARAVLPRGQAFMRSLRIPNVSASESAQILRLQIPQNFPVQPAELVFAYRLTADAGPEGRLAVVCATRAESVRALHAALRESGAKVQDVLPASAGSMLLAESLGMPEVAVVERTPEGWAIDIVSAGELRYSRVVPLETSEAALESEVCRTFGIAGLPCGPILAAGGAELAFAQAHTGRSPLEMLASPAAAGLGLALELPEVAEAKQRKLVQSRARLAAMLALATLGVGAVVFLDRAEAAEAVQKADARGKAQSRKFKSARDAAQSRLAKLKAPTEMLDRAFQPAQRASDVLALASALAPSDVWLTGVTFERGKPLLVRGTALSGASVAAYLQSLSGQSRFRDVKLVFANDATIETTQVQQFSISAHAVGNLPLTDPKAQGRAASR